MKRVLIIFGITFLFSCEKDDRSRTLADPTTVTVFLYENCSISRYMSGPLRNSYRYFCDTLNADIFFQGFSPNTFSTNESINNFVEKYDIPFNVSLDPNGVYSERYQPIVTPEVFVEFEGRVVYRGMIDNSYESLGEWAPATQHYLSNILYDIVNGEDITYFETTAIGCFINY